MPRERVEVTAGRITDAVYKKIASEGGAWPGHENIQDIVEYVLENPKEVPEDGS